MAKNKYYVVNWGGGQEPELFDDWGTCSKAITGRSYISQNGFKDLESAKAAIRAAKTGAAKDDLPFGSSEEGSVRPKAAIKRPLAPAGAKKVPARQTAAKPVASNGYLDQILAFYENNKGVYEVHSDGGARPNPGNGGYGYVVVGPDLEILEEGYGAYENATNNQMELQGAIEGFRKVPEGGRAVFMTDSKLVYTGLGTNLDKDSRPRFIKWEERGWKDVANLEQVQTLYALGKAHGVTCIPRPLNARGTDYARMGHLEHGAAKLLDGKWEFPYNKICDKLAEYGEEAASRGQYGPVILITGGVCVDSRALLVKDRDAAGHGKVVDQTGSEIAVN